MKIENNNANLSLRIISYTSCNTYRNIWNDCFHFPFLQNTDPGNQYSHGFLVLLLVESDQLQQR